MVRYYQILGVKPKATLEQIKKAYRKRAKELHPDVNKSENAHEEFILLNEAFEYLQNLKTGKRYDNRTREYTRSKKSKASRHSWEERDRERARQRAKEHAQMEYEKFTQTDFYKTSEALGLVIELIYLLLGVAVLVICPILGYNISGASGLIGAGVIILVVSPLFIGVFRDKAGKIPIREIIPSFVLLLTNKYFLLTLAIALNVYLLLEIGFNTLITTGVFFSLYQGAIVLGLLVALKFKKRYTRNLIIFGIAPGLINIFLLVNFVFATPDARETYSFRRVKYSSKRGYYSSTHITLKDDKYSEYLGIRVFFDADQMDHRNKITYDFANGLFGIRVIKSHEFRLEGVIPLKN